ncbi:tRNA pseudouridine(55) synthase TruB [Citricoccus sp. GCM10030269]|uniref:tRNA pseudouridine(55) synthase TruB n=1 Tax=Citricoccus sp. GCM10030269 TaxID=3273388 RepID=UPI00362310DE
MPPGAPGSQTSGLVLVDKPAGWTSHDVVGRVRRLAGTRKVGHAGTLDPMATGLLVIGFNKATRLLTAITGTGKTYLATIRLGVSTVTDDAEGEVVQTRLANAVTPERVAAAIAELTGEIEQVPSAVSAIKVNGQRAYHRVRAGEDVRLQARTVIVHRFEVTDYRRGDGGRTVDLDVEVDCSSGTYIRALARDLGEALETGGHLTALRRTAVGPFSVDDAVTLEQLAERFTATELSEAASGLFPVRRLTAEEAEELSFGRRIDPTGREGTVAGQAPDGTVVALISDQDSAAKPEIVFAPAVGGGRT